MISILRTKIRSLFPFKLDLKRSLLISILVIGFMYLFGYFYLFPHLASANWFNDNWVYRTPYIISNTGTSQTNVKVKLDVDTATLITNGKMQSSCQDSRFTDQTGKPLKFFIENGSALATFDSDTTGKTSTTTITTYSLSHTVNSGSNRFLAVMVHSLNTNSSGVTLPEDPQVLKITYNGTELSRQVYVTDRNTNRNYNSEIWTLVAPDTGSNTLTVTYKNDNSTDTTPPDRLIVEAMNFTGVDQFDPVGARLADVTKSGTPQTMNESMITESDNSIIIAGGQQRNDSGRTITLSTGTSDYADNTGTSSTDITAGGGHQSASIAGNQTITLSSTGTSSYMDFVALEIKSSSGRLSNIAMVSRTIIGKTADSASSTISTTNTIPSGTNPLLAVVVQGMRSAVGAEGVDIDVSGITYDGTAMTRQVFADSNSSSRRLLTEIWTLKNATVGVGKTLTATFSGANPDRKIMTAYNLTGVDQTNIVGGTATSSANSIDTSISTNLTTTYSDSIILGGAMARLNDNDLDGVYLSSGNTFFQNYTDPRNSSEFAYTQGIIKTEDSGTVYNVEAKTLNDQAFPTLNIAAIELHSAAADPSPSGGCNDASTDYYVLLPSLTAGSNTIYHYYGNPTIRAGFLGSQFVESNAVTYSVSAGTEAFGPGPESYWKLDEGTGIVAQDSMQQNNDGTLTSGPAWQEGSQCISGKCLFFDGTDDYVSITDPSNGSLDPTTTMTISAWVKPNSEGANDFGRIISEIGDVDVFVQDDTDGLVDLCAETTGITNSCATNVISLNEWTNIAVVYTDNNSRQFFVNGRLVATNDSTNSLTNSSSNKIIGNNAALTRPFKGFMDELKVYPYARSVTQILTDYNTMAAASREGNSSVLGAGDNAFLNKGLIGYWKMDDSSGSATDSSGNGITLGNTGSTPYASGKFGNAAVFNSGQRLTSASTIAGVKTVSFWAKVDATNNNFINLSGSAYIIASGSSISTSGITSPNIFVNGITSTTLSTASSWQLITVTTETAISASTFEIGRANGSATTGDQIDDVRLYNRVLSPAEVVKLYNWAPGPTGYWNLDENTGSTFVSDRSGLGVTGTMNGLSGVSWIPGKYGSALDFDGTNAWLDMNDGSNDNLDVGATSNFTLSFWFNRRSFTTDDTIIAKKNDQTSSTAGYIVWIDDSTDDIRLEVADGDGSNSLTIDGTSTFTSTGWNHVEIVYDGSSSSASKIYVNGVDDGATATITGSFASIASLGNSVDFTIGAESDHTASNSFDGYIDDVKFYNYTRSSSQVIQDMNAGHPISGSPVGSEIAHWKFNEGVGTTANNSVVGRSAFNGALTSFAAPASAVSGWTLSGQQYAALNFDGTDDYVNTAMDFYSDAFSVCAWVNPALLDSNPRTIVTKRNSSGITAGTVEWNFFADSTRVGYGSNNAAVASTLTMNTTEVLTINTWSHVCMVQNGAGNTGYIYINGHQATSALQGAAMVDTANPVQIGVRTNTDSNRYWRGSIDDVKIYTTGLTPDEVKTEYNHGKAIVLGATSTDSSGNGDNSASRLYCVPGDTTSTCTSPQGEWKLDENTGTSFVSDTSGVGVTGNMNGFMNSSWIPGKLGSALDFDGTNAWLDMNDGSSNNLDVVDGSNFTVSFWFNRKSFTTDDTIIAKKNDQTSGTAGYIIWIDDSTDDIRLEVSDGDSTNTLTIDGTSTFTSTGWNHVEIVYNDSASTASKIYVNGVEDRTSSTLTGTFANIASLGNAVDFTIGAESDHTAPNSFDGFIDDVKFYSYARTASQVAWDYNHGGPIGWYKFNECQGTTAYNSVRTGNNEPLGSHGTINFGASGNTAAGVCNSGVSTEMWNDGTTGKLNASLGFDGTDDYVTALSSGIINPSSGAVAMWVKPDGLQSAPSYVFSHPRGTNNSRVYMNFQAGSPSLTLDCRLGDGTVIGTYTLPDAQWTHLVCMWNGTSAKFFVNGQDTTSTSTFNGMTDLNTDFYIGSNNAAQQFFRGQIDDVRIYNFPINQTQVKTVYNDGAVNFK